uniref:aspartate-semialdehyde dehydrogenase n=1 Tax=Noctiluca scintillans TaxID=2966 RepID=A0A7S1AMQ7_NOCSC
MAQAVSGGSLFVVQMARGRSLRLLSVASASLLTWVVTRWSADVLSFATSPSAVHLAESSQLQTSSFRPTDGETAWTSTGRDGSGAFSIAGMAMVAGVALAATNRRKPVRSLAASSRVQVSATAGHIDCLAIVGASGAVGQEMLNCVEKRDFPTNKVRLFAKRSAGETVKTKFGDVVVEPFSVEAVQECEVALLAVSGDFSKEFSPLIRGGSKGTVVVDNSSAWRYDKDVPLIVPEINGSAGEGSNLLSNPNCTTAIGAMTLWPLHQKYKLKKVIMSTYQAASGAGAEGMKELEEGLVAYATGGAVPTPEVFAHQLPFNVIPQIDAFQENGYTKEEMKVTWELEKIFSLDEDVKVSCTAVRVPTLRAHSESITIETELPIDPAGAREVLEHADGVVVVDDTSSMLYPMPLNVTGEDDVEVGRIRQSIVFGDHGLDFFLSGDQLLRGAALNAVIIAEQKVKERFGSA